MNKSIFLSAATALWISSFGLSLTASADDNLLAAVYNKNRSPEHRGLDSRREPYEILKFAGVKKGMTIVDVNSGMGYYTVILSNAVGDEGMVYAHNGNHYWNLMRNRVPENLTGLKNVKSIAGPESPQVPAGSVDMVTSVLTYHDYYYDNKDRGEETVAEINKALYHALKPGGIYVVIDHVGTKGMSLEAMDKLHRIDPDRVRKEVVAAGFEFVAETDVLANPYNAGDASWFGVKPNYTTNRFVYKFRKN